jgi:hypothetical protein
MKDQLFDAYVEACNYPGKIDETQVEMRLSAYLGALGIKRKIVRLRQGWTLEEYPDLNKSTNLILDDFAKRAGYKPARAARAAIAARDAIAAIDASDAIDAIDARDGAPRRFASWCIQGRGWWWWNWELSWISTTYFGARQLKKSAVEAWSEPLLHAYLNGCWILFWTEETLYWVAKPTVHVEKTSQSRRLHNETFAALESDVENLYFWHGVLVPAFVVVKPEWITMEHVRKEENAEVRRVMIERMGWDKFCSEAKLKVIHRDEMKANFPSLPVSETVHADMRAVTSYRKGKEVAELLESEEFKDFDDRPLKFVRVTDPSTGERYVLRVWPENQRAYEAIGQTFGMSEVEYKESVLSHS